MSKIPIMMDFISGLLLAYDLYPNKSGILLTFNNWVRRNLLETDTGNITNKRTIVFSMTISAFIFLMILAWAWYKGSSHPEPASQAGAEFGLFLIGAVAAWFLMTLVATLLRGENQEVPILLIGIVVAAVALGLVPTLKPSVDVVVALIAFVYMSMLYPFSMVVAGRVRRLLLADQEKPFYIFAMLGLALFVVSKLIELTV